MNARARKILFRPLLSTLFLLAVFATQSSFAQELPKVIRGYKVHRETVRVIHNGSDQSNETGAEAIVNIHELRLIDVSLSGISFEFSPEISAMEQSGRVDFMTFHDFRVNGIPVDVEEYSESFPFRKNEPLKFPKPARAFLPTHRILQAAWKEMKESEKEWTVTGRVFVFGTFKKYGFSFKRVVPVDISVKITNPLV